MSLLIFIQDDTTCSLALSSQGSNTDLDPLTDSLVELGFDFSDAGAGGHRSNMTGQQRHHLQRQAQPSPLATTLARAPAQSSRGKLRCAKPIALFPPLPPNMLFLTFPVLTTCRAPKHWLQAV